MQKYAFLDRDGTFLWEPEKPKNANPRNTFPLKSMKEFSFMKGAIDGMLKLHSKRYKLVMVTNQTLLGTGKHPKKMFDKVMEKLTKNCKRKVCTLSTKWCALTVLTKGVSAASRKS